MTGTSPSAEGTDRRINSVEDLEQVDFAKGAGLVTVVAQDATSGRVLMVGYANREALEATLEGSLLHFWSRSRGRLWQKGESSGNVLRLQALHLDCDGDAVLALVDPVGATCHTGESSCFGRRSEPTGYAPPVGSAVLRRLDATIESRSRERPEGSYTTRLLDDPNLRLKKIGEESAELVAALATSNRSRAVEESADLVYHVLVALRAEGAGVEALLEELERRG